MYVTMLGVVVLVYTNSTSSTLNLNMTEFFLQYSTVQTTVTEKFFFTMKWLGLKLWYYYYESWVGLSESVVYFNVGWVQWCSCVCINSICEKRKEKKQSWCKHRNTTQESVFSMRCSCSPSLSQELLHFSTCLLAAQLDHIMGLYLVEYCQSMFAISAGSCCTLALYMHTYILLYKKQKFKYKNIRYTYIV